MPLCWKSNLQFIGGEANHQSGTTTLELTANNIYNEIYSD